MTSAFLPQKEGAVPTKRDGGPRLCLASTQVSDAPLRPKLPMVALNRNPVSQEPTNSSLVWFRGIGVETVGKKKKLWCSESVTLNREEASLFYSRGEWGAVCPDFCLLKASKQGSVSSGPFTPPHPLHMKLATVRYPEICRKTSRESITILLQSHFFRIAHHPPPQSSGVFLSCTGVSAPGGGEHGNLLELASFLSKQGLSVFFSDIMLLQAGPVLLNCMPLDGRDSLLLV